MKMAIYGKYSIYMHHVKAFCAAKHVKVLLGYECHILYIA